MARSYLPAGMRSATAVSGISDIQDQVIYSSGLLQNGGLGQLSLFSQPKGASIPFLRGSGISAPTNAWQLQYADQTTNIEKAGELGDGIGDIAVRGISLHAEEASQNPAAAALTTYGATQYELADLNRKASFEFKVSKKPMYKSPFFGLPDVGGVSGGVSTTANNVLRSLATNGTPGNIRRLVKQIQCSRRDTIEGLLVINQTALLCRTTDSDGAPFLVWCLMPSTVRGDVR